MKVRLRGLVVVLLMASACGGGGVPRWSPRPVPPVPPIAVEPSPVVPWRPTREQVRAFKGDYLGMFAERGPFHFTAQYCGSDAERRAYLRHETKARGYTHLLVTWALGYRDYPRFNLAHEPERFRDCLDELFADRLIPVVVVTQFEETGMTPSAERVLLVWRRIVDVVGCDRVPVQIMGWEWNDATLLMDQREITRGAVARCPDAYTGVHFTPDRWAASPPRLDLPTGPNPWDDSEASFWFDMQAMGLDALFFQSGERDDLAVFKARLEEVAFRLRGHPSVPPAYAGLQIDTIAFEHCDPHNLQGRSGRDEAFCREMGRIALTVPGVVGYLNGGPP